MKEKNYHLFIVAFFILDCPIRFRAAYSHESLEKHPVVAHTVSLKHYMYIQSDDISGVEGHELVWLQSDKKVTYS